jgi:HK97 gp10 family phage protein
MINIQVSIKPSAENLAKAFMNQNLKTFLLGEINRLAAGVERYAKQLTPVDTGRLRASIFYSPANSFLQAVVSTNTEYAIYVHEGTKYMRARPFMKYGAMFAELEQRTDFQGRLDAEFTKAFKTLT